jgi:hypothetical protein
MTECNRTSVRISIRPIIIANSKRFMIKEVKGRNIYQHAIEDRSEAKRETFHVSTIEQAMGIKA